VRSKTARPFVSFDTGALSDCLSIHGVDSILSTAEKQEVDVAIPMLVVAEICAGCGESSDRRIEALTRLISSRCTRILPDIREMIALELGYHAEYSDLRRVAEFWDLFRAELSTRGATESIREAAIEWLAKGVTATLDRSAEASIRARFGSRLDPTIRDIFIKGLPESAQHSSWAIELVVDRIRVHFEGLDTLWETSLYARAFATWAQIRALGAVSEGGGECSQFFRGLARGKNDWVDLRIGAISVESNVFVSDDPHQRLIYNQIADKIVRLGSIAKSSDEWIRGSIAKPSDEEITFTRYQ